MNTPVLLVVYKRLDKVLSLIDSLKEIKPSLIYVSANAPKNDDERIQCDAIKMAINNISWDCTIYKKYESIHIADQAFSIANGISWFFSNVDYGIILEDDCIPHPSFFQLCSALLQTYKDDKSVYQISGTNINYDHNGPASLLSTFFSLPPWGWATWKRCWDKYNPQMNNWREAEDLIKTTVSDFAFWEKQLDSNSVTKAGWDLQWNVDIWINKGKILMPSYNLVTNIGFDENATYTFNPNNILANLPVQRFTLPGNDLVLPADDLKIESNLIRCFKTLRKNT